MLKKRSTGLFRKSKRVYWRIDSQRWKHPLTATSLSFRLCWRISRTVSTTSKRALHDVTKELNFENNNNKTALGGSSTISTLTKARKKTPSAHVLKTHYSRNVPCSNSTTDANFYLILHSDSVAPSRPKY